MSATIVPLRANAAQPSLAPILSLTAAGMNAVNATILDRMQSEIPLIP
ncbi:MAG: polyprenyl synthetase family protein, partial [Novosphingobium sp.]